MNHSISHQPSFSLLKIELESGETLKAEAGAMAYMTSSLQVETKFGSGILSAVARKFLGGESLFFNIFKATEKSQLGIAPTLPGVNIYIPMSSNKLIVQAGSYLCSSETVDLKAKFGGLKSFFGGEGAFLLEVGGNGDLFLNSYGAILEIDVNGKYTLDTGHLVAFEETLNYNIKKVGSWKSTLFSGEGLVFEFEGQGKLYIQTRVPGGFISWLTGLLPS